MPFFFSKRERLPTESQSDRQVINKANEIVANTLTPEYRIYMGVLQCKTGQGAPVEVSAKDMNRRCINFGLQQLTPEQLDMMLPGGGQCVKRGI